MSRDRRLVGALLFFGAAVALLVAVLLTDRTVPPRNTDDPWSNAAEDDAHAEGEVRDQDRDDEPGQDVVQHDYGEHSETRTDQAATEAKAHDQEHDPANDNDPAAAAPDDDDHHSAANDNDPDASNNDDRADRHSADDDHDADSDDHRRDDTDDARAGPRRRLARYRSRVSSVHSRSETVGAARSILRSARPSVARPSEPLRDGLETERAGRGRHRDP